MTPYNKATIRPDADFFKALGHPTRLWMVEQLSDGQEHCVCEFVAAVGDEFPTISRHLSILKEAKVVEDERRGKQIFYRLACPCISGLLKCLRKRNG